MAGRIGYFGGIVTNGLVFHLDAAKKESYSRSGVEWNDLSGNNNDGTLTNGPTFDSGNYGSIVFDGADDHVVSGFDTNFSTVDFTIEAWVYPEFDSATYGRPIITKNGPGDLCGTYDFALEYGRITNKFSLVFGGGSGGSIVLYSDNTWDSSEWYHVVASREYISGSSYTCSVYINGVRDMFMGGAYDSGYGTDVGIGKFLGCAVVDEWLGKIASCKIYNRSLTQEEISQNYNTLKGRYNL
jgi:hypothetical protein